MITQVVFDLDGTLIDSAPSILASLAASLSSNGIAPIISLDSSIIGPPLRETLSHLTGETDAGVLDALTVSFKSYYDSVGYKATKTFPDIPELLQALQRQGIPLHIATNKREKPTRLILEYLEWAGLFREIYALDSVEPPYSNKSNMLRRILQDLGAINGQVAYVGDKLDDGLAADENSMPFFMARWGYGTSDDEKKHPNWRVLHAPVDLLKSRVFIREFKFEVQL